MDETVVYNFLKESNYRHFKNSRKRLKEKLVQYKGGKCEICGYNKCIIALEFHHLDPTQKDFNIGNGNVVAFEKAKEEVDKCILVCSNCHREIHYQEYLMQQEEERKQNESIYVEVINNREKYGNIPIKNSYKYLTYTDIFTDIENKLPRKDILKKYCINNATFNKFLTENNIFYSNKKTVINKPTKEELINLLENYSKSAIGRMFGVTCNAVIKWCKKYNIN